MTEKRVFKRSKIKGGNGRMYSFNDLTNERFGRLVALGINGKDKNRHLMWECVCDCGSVKDVAGTSLVEGYTMSCGCYHGEAISKSKTTHGKCKTKLYYVYRGMIGRCYGNEKKYQKLYKGKRFVCDRWRDSFQNFYDDMNASYKEGLQLDRINNDGDYEPSNCRWATSMVNSNNKSNNKKYTIGGQTFGIVEWARITGTDRNTIYGRLKRGWDINRAVYGEPVTSINQISEYLVF